MALVLLAPLGVTPARGQELLDRVMATIGGRPVTLTDVTLARGLGLVTSDAGPDAESDAVRQLIDRRLLAIELARLPPREPSAEAIDAEVARLRQRAGTAWAALLRATGYDEPSVRDLARETLRIAAYLMQRYGAGASVSSPEARQLLSDLRLRAQVQVVTDAR